MVFNTTQFAMGQNLIPQKLHGWDENWSHSAVPWPLNVWDLLQMLQKTNGFPLQYIPYIFVELPEMLHLQTENSKNHQLTNWPKSKILHFSLPCIGAWRTSFAGDSPSLGPPTSTAGQANLPAAAAGAAAVPAALLGAGVGALEPEGFRQLGAWRVHGDYNSREMGNKLTLYIIGLTIGQYHSKIKGIFMGSQSNDFTTGYGPIVAFAKYSLHQKK